MITSLRIENYKAFNEKVELNLEADARNKKLFTNYITLGKYNVLKSAGIYGKNNVGKTCIIDAVDTIKKVLMNLPVIMNPNIFYNNSIVSLGISFISDDFGFSFDFKFDTEKQEYVYENYSTFDVYNKNRKKVLILKDTINNIYESEDENFEALLPNLSNTNIVLYTANTAFFPKVDKLKNIFIYFATRMQVVKLTNIPISRTIDELKRNSSNVKEIVDFIKRADLEIEKFGYSDNIKINVSRLEGSQMAPPEKVLEGANLADIYKLFSVHKGRYMPFVAFDSTGTKKIVALASYIVDNIKDGGTLFVDELDNGLHFELARAIVSMYNSEANTKGQLVFTTHDVCLLDCKKLLRKEQIWFASKDADRTYLYSLNDFKSRDEIGVRSESDIVDLYKKGVFADLPEPDLIKWLMEVVNGK